MAGVNILYGRTEGRVKRTGKGEPPPHWKSFRPGLMSGWAAAPRSKEMSSKRIAKRAGKDMSLEKARKAIFVCG